MSTSDHDNLKSYLEEQGHTPAEVEKIMRKIEEYDRNTVADSIFDSLGQDTVNLDAFIKKALADDPNEPSTAD